ncbi:MAG: glutamate-1-semialdehyde 2,1-aminomutase [Deltaproteobacteria bacterium]
MNTTKSEALFERAQQLIPGGVNSPVRAFKHVGRNPIYFERGEGAFLFDVDGNRYIDFCASFGPLILGHSHPTVVEAIKTQAAKATTFGACHEKEVQLAELILKSFPYLDQVRLLNSGTEAVMTAIRIARGATQRPKILKFEGCYHGHSDGLLAKSGSGVAELAESSSKGVPESIVQETVVARFDSMESIERAFKQFGSQLAAVILEPIPANEGLWVPEKSRLEFIFSLAKQHGALVIFDEVISGFRVGISGAAGYFGLQPDLVTLGKIIGGGLPLAACLGTQRVMSQVAPMGPVYQAGTLSGNPLATAAGIAVLKELHLNPPYQALETRTRRFVNRIKEEVLPNWHFVQLGSVFWMSPSPLNGVFPPEISVEDKKAYARVFGKALEAGLYFAPSPFEVGFVSTVHTEKVLDEAVEKLKQCLK